MSNDDTFQLDLNAEISKRKLLGALGAVGAGAAASGVGTFALLSDRESFGTANNPNVIQTGEVDLTVDWEVVYFGPGSPQTIAEQDEPVDRPGPIVNVTDLKPGDIIEKTLSTHIETNPGFLLFDMSVLANEDNGINNPEDAVDGTFDGSDGTAGGDLADNINCVVWHDGFEDSEGNDGGSGGSPGNNRPDEGIWTAGGDPTNDADFEAELDSAHSPADAFDTESDLVIASGTLAELAGTSNPILIDSRDQGDAPSDFSTSACYDDGSVQYIGCVCWLPRDVPGIEDNLLQTDRLEYQLEFRAIQCRDNVADDGTPLSTDVAGQASPAFPETQLDKLSAQNDVTSQSDRFGTAVAIDGDTIIVGATGDENAGTEVYGDNEGAAYVFTKSGGSWSQQAELTADDGDSDDLFGESVALDGDTALVGAYNDEDPNGDDPTVNTASGAGSAYVFTRSGSSWSQQEKLSAQDSGADSYDSFGSAVALDGSTALIGAPTDEDPNGVGSTYVFTRSGSSWSQQAKLSDPGGGTKSFARFGNSVAVVGDTALIGAQSDPVNGSFSGAAHVFTRSGNTWTHQTKLTPQDSNADTYDRFGRSVALDGSTALIGAYNDEDPNGSDSGSAYVFTGSGSNWNQQAKLSAQDSNADSGDRFGWSVALDADTALVGAGTDEDPNGSNSGSAYVFTGSGSSWSQQTKLSASDGDSSDDFGRSVALDGETALVGAEGDEDPNGGAEGSAYVFGP